MKEITVMNRINKLIENINYKTAYIEIKTDKDSFIIEKQKKNEIGFKFKEE